MAVVRLAPDEMQAAMASGVGGGVPGGRFWWNVRDRAWDIEVWVSKSVASKSKMMSWVGEDIAIGANRLRY
jgi:hypothetical protein